MAIKLTSEEVKKKYDKCDSELSDGNYKNKINEIFTKFFPRYKRSNINSTFSNNISSTNRGGNRAVGFNTNRGGNANRNNKTFNNNVSNVGVDLATTRRNNIINEIYGSSFELGFTFKDTTKIKFKRKGYTNDEIKSIEREFLGVMEEEILSVISNSNYRQTRDTVIGQLDTIGSTCEVIEKNIAGKYIFTAVNMLDVSCIPIAGGMEDVIFIERSSTYLDFSTWLMSTYGESYDFGEKS